ncbi:hypothetical protein Tco_1100702 [Tanacetum coccineum]
MGDEVISTNLARENDKFIKSSVDDLVPIPMESEVTSDSNSECDMPVNTPLPTTDVREEDFDINSPLREQVVDFLMENEDVAGLPRHLVKQFFSHLVKHLSSTKRMSDEPLGDDSKPRSYDVTFSNPLFDFNDDFTLCNSDSMSRSIETSDLILEELTAEIDLDDSISTEIDDGSFYFDADHQEEKSSGSTTSHSNLSLPSYESFCFDIDHQEEKSSGSTTSRFDHSLPDYEAFCFDHQEDKRSGSTTSHSDPSILEYESFYFDLSIDPLPPTEMSDSHHKEFADELAHIISPPEYDHFYFDIKVDPGESTRLLIENLSSKNVNLTEIKEDNELKPKTSTKELTIHELNDLRLLLSNCDSTFSKEFSKIKFLVSFPSGNKDKNFDLGIFIIKGVYSKRSHILPLNDFSHISFVSDLLLTGPSQIETFLSFPFGNEDKVFVPLGFSLSMEFSLSRENLHICWMIISRTIKVIF